MLSPDGVEVVSLLLGYLFLRIALLDLLVNPPEVAFCYRSEIVMDDIKASGKLGKSVDHSVLKFGFLDAFFMN